jgi:hypothetical protein
MFRSIGFAAVLALGFSSSAAADTVVLKGTDYFQTLPGTTFAGQPFKGVPVGPENTDTIIRRLGDVDFDMGLTTIPIEMVALQLQSIAPTDLGLGLGFYFITLQSARTGGGTKTFGEMTMNLTHPDDGVRLPDNPEGTFSSFLDVFFDVRLGAVDGPIALSQMMRLTSPSTKWDATPGPMDFLVFGPVGDQDANRHTNRKATEMDFFPFDVEESHPNGSIHVAELTKTPEPASFLLMATGLAGLRALRQRKGRKQR